MSAKNFILDFINYLFIILLVIFTIFFFIDPDRFAVFTEILKSLLPLSVFVLIFLIKLKLGRGELDRKREESGFDLVLYLDYFDKFKAELLVFALPIIIFLVPLLAGGQPGLSDFLQAAIAFLLMYLWQKNLFKKSR